MLESGSGDDGRSRGLIRSGGGAEASVTEVIGARSEADEDAMIGDIGDCSALGGSIFTGTGGEGSWIDLDGDMDPFIRGETS